MSDRKKVLVVGGVGSNNIGDDAMLINVIHDVEKYLPGAEISVMVEDPDVLGYLSNVVRYPFIKSINHYFSYYSKERFDRLRELFTDEWTLKNRRLIARGMNLVNNVSTIEALQGIPDYVKKAVIALRSSDVIIDVGGANLNEIWKIYFYEKCFNFLIAGKAKKKLILSGQSVEPIRSGLDRKLLVDALNSAVDITTRERISEEYIRRIGVRTNIETTGDDALTLAIPSESEIGELLKRESLDSSENYIGFQFRNYLDLKNEEVYKKIAASIDKAIESTGFKVVCIPFHYGISDERNDVDKVIAHSRYKDRILKVHGHYDAVQIKGFVSRMKLCLGISYHFYIYCASLGIPVLPLYKGAHYTQKFEGLTELFGLQNMKADLGSLSDSSLAQTVDHFIQQEDHIRKTLAEKVNLLKEKVHRSRLRWQSKN